MSLKKISILAVLGLSLGGVTAWIQESGGRKPASVAHLPAPKLKLQPWSESTQGKMNQAINIEITTVGGVPDRDDQELRLKATVTLNQAMTGDVEYQWSLPADASLVSGELSDVWPGLQRLKSQY